MFATRCKIGLVAALTATLLAGCAAVPRDRAQLVPMTAGQVGLGGGDSPQIAPNWWIALGDPQLDRIMADALAGNPSLLEAMARVRQANAGIDAEKAGLLPQVSADANETRERLSGKYIIPPPYGGSGQWVGTAQANLSWSLDFAGRQKALVDQARSTSVAAGLDVEAARISLSGAVAGAYVNLARADAQARIATEFVASRQEALGLAQVRVRNQLASDFDLRAAETLLAEARQSQARAEGDRKIMIHALAALAGRGADYYITVTPPAIVVDRAIPLPKALPADLLGRRPDILAARARIESADAGRRVAKADFYPNVDLRAFIGVSALGLGSLFTGGAATYGAGPAVHLPIFQGGQLRARYRGALAGTDVAIADYDGRVVQAIREAADTLSAVDTNAADAAQQKQIVAGLGETVRLDQVRLRTGLGARLDILAAGDRLLAARQRMVDVDADGAIRRVQLLIALGGGFTPPANTIAAADAVASPR
jgi:NodT family efflux transporter outer membrane factor (OMF) lipoprotein